MLAFAASAFVYHAFRQAAATPAAIAMQHIVVADEPLPLGTLLDASKLRTISWPANEPVAGMFTKIEDATSRALITIRRGKRADPRGQTCSSRSRRGPARHDSGGNAGALGRRE